MSDRLHRIHAAPATGKGGCRLDVGGVTWRGEGGGDGRRAMAHRLGLAWNLLEGWPTEALERGVLREVDDLAHELADEVLALGDDAPRELTRIATLLRAAFAERDPHQDLTDGRPADCDACYPPEAAPALAAGASSPIADGDAT